MSTYSLSRRYSKSVLAAKMLYSNQDQNIYPLIKYAKHSSTGRFSHLVETGESRLKKKIAEAQLLNQDTVILSRYDALHILLMIERMTWPLTNNPVQKAVESVVDEMVRPRKIPLWERIQMTTSHNPRNTT